MKRSIAVLFALAVAWSSGATPASGETFGVKKQRPKHDEFGNVVINNYSESKQMAPVVFRHWLHRAEYTCRLCHVDLGFAMVAGDTGMTEDENRMGLYCGACHNGVTAFAHEDKGRRGEQEEVCQRCHSLGKAEKPRKSFLALKKRLPRERFGNGIDWLTSEEQKKIELVDYLEGISIPRKKLRNPEDLVLSTDELDMPDIIFSHEKHAVWNGCELCHPEIFPVRTGSQPYNMQEIFDGMYCGACHGKVAFPNLDCQRCHTKDVFMESSQD